MWQKVCIVLQSYALGSALAVLWYQFLHSPERIYSDSYPNGP